jgi:FkbM family methyltransferase
LNDSDRSCAGQVLALPDGTTVEVPNTNEAMFVYREVFESRVYLRHGLRINDGACVLDVGANVGLFTLFALREAADVVVHAFEPSSELCGFLRTNLRAHAGNVTIHPVGVGAEDGDATLTYYPRYTILSGFHAEEHQDAEVLRSAIRNQNRRTSAKGIDLDDRHLDVLVSRLLADKSERRCRLRTLSGVIDEYRIRTVSLLKVDAERSEWNILQGIREEHWPTISQVAMEVHDGDGETLRAVRGLLDAKGFTVMADQEEQFSGEGIVNLYARRG